MTPAQFWQHLNEHEAARKAQIEAVRIRATGNSLAAQNDEPEPRQPRTFRVIHESVQAECRQIVRGDKL